MADVAGWHVTMKIDTGGFDDDQLERAYDRLGPGHAGWHDMTTTLTLSKYVEADDFRTAAVTGMDVILNAFAASGIDGEVASMEVQKHDEEAINEGLRRFWRETFVGTSEIAEMLGVSRQRVSELARTHAEFPKPVDRLRSGPIYDRAEVEAFERTWERRRTGRPRKNAS